MRFLVDECTGTSVIACLRSAGHDAVAKERIVVTNDKDFGEMVFRSGRLHRGTVWRIGKSANRRMGEWRMANGRMANPRLETAIRHSQSAIRWDAVNSQAYRLLGRAYLAQGDLVAAGALTRFTELRPDNPLGHIEPGDVYETMVNVTTAEETW